VNERTNVEDPINLPTSPVYVKMLGWVLSGLRLPFKLLPLPSSALDCPEDILLDSHHSSWKTIVHQVTRYRSNCARNHSFLDPDRLQDSFVDRNNRVGRTMIYPCLVRKTHSPFLSPLDRISETKFPKTVWTIEAKLEEREKWKTKKTSFVGKSRFSPFLLTCVSCQPVSQPAEKTLLHHRPLFCNQHFARLLKISSHESLYTSQLLSVIEQGIAVNPGGPCSDPVGTVRQQRLGHVRRNCARR
jgi:hypothetical protein